MESFLPQLVPSGTPLYEQVKHALLAALASGEWKQGEAIPPEKSLAERFNVSIGTLRKAIDELAAENILIRHQGRGTFVAVHTRDRHFFKFFRIVRQDSHKSYPVTVLKSFSRIQPAPEIAQKLLLGPEAYVFQFVNCQFLNGDAVTIDTISVPEALFSGMTAEELDQRQSTLYNFYQDAYGINVIGTDERLRVALADADHAKWLGLPVQSPLLEVRRLAFSYNQVPVEWRVSRVNTAAYEYVGQEHK